MSQVHPRARTTPRVRAEIRNSTVGVTALTDLYNMSVATVDSGEDLTIRALAVTIAGVVGCKGTFVQDTSKPDGTIRKVMDTSRIQQLGWTPTTVLAEGIHRADESYLRP